MYETVVEPSRTSARMSLRSETERDRGRGEQEGARDHEVRRARAAAAAAVVVGRGGVARLQHERVGERRDAVERRAQRRLPRGTVLLTSVSQTEVKQPRDARLQRVAHRDDE